MVTLLDHTASTFEQFDLKSTQQTLRLNHVFGLSSILFPNPLLSQGKQQYLSSRRTLCSCCCWRNSLPITHFLKPTLFCHCGKNICCHALVSHCKESLLNLGKELLWIPACGFCRKGETIMPWLQLISYFTKDTFSLLIYCELQSNFSFYFDKGCFPKSYLHSHSSNKKNSYFII